jgi:hypothetical protein
VKKRAHRIFKRAVTCPREKKVRAPSKEIVEEAPTGVLDKKDGRRKSSQFVCKLSAAPQLPLPDALHYGKPQNHL